MGVISITSLENEDNSLLRSETKDVAKLKKSNISQSFILHIPLVVCHEGFDRQARINCGRKLKPGKNNEIRIEQRLVGVFPPSMPAPDSSVSIQLQACHNPCGGLLG